VSPLGREEAMRRIERIVLQEWMAADQQGERLFPHEFLYRVLRSKILEPLYEIDPRDHIRIQKEADAMGFDIVGYYHSHPDHPAQASRFDTERAWAGYVYLIVSIQDGEAVDANCFVADKDGGPFHPEPLEVA